MTDTLTETQLALLAASNGATLDVRPTGREGSKLTITHDSTAWVFVRYSDADEWHLDYRADNGRPNYTVRGEVVWDTPEHHTLDAWEEPFVCVYCLQVPRKHDRLDPVTERCGRCDDNLADDELDTYMAQAEDYRPTLPGNGQQYRDGWTP